MTDNPTYGSSLVSNMQLSKTPVERASTDDHQFRLAPSLGDSLLPASTANFLDEKRFPSLMQFLPHPEPMIDLTLDEDEDDEESKDATEVSWLMNVRHNSTYHITDSSLIDRPLPIADYCSVIRVPLLTDVKYSHSRRLHNVIYSSHA